MEKPSARSVALGIVALCVSAAVALNAVDSSHTRQLVAEQEQAAQAARKPSIRDALAEKKAEVAARPASDPAQAQKPREAAL